MNLEELNIFIKACGTIPTNPFKHEWERVKCEIEPHFYGNPPKALEEAFPNEDLTILEYRKKTYAAKTESPMVKAQTELFRLLSSSKYSVSFDSQDMQNWYNEWRMGDYSFFRWYFGTVVPLRVLDANAVFVVWPTGPGIQDPTKKFDIKFEIIPSSRVIFNDPDFDLLIYKNELNRKYIGFQKPQGVDESEFPQLFYEYVIITSELYAYYSPGKDIFVETFPQNKQGKPIGLRPWFTLGGRAIPKYIDGNQYIFYKSDFSPAVPYLNDAAIYDSQAKSVMLASCFPVRVTQGINCQTCRGSGFVHDEESGGNKDCGTCKGSGKVTGISPLAGIQLIPHQGYGPEKEVPDFIRYYAPDTSTITVVLEKANDALTKAENVLNLNRTIQSAQSAIAKEQDKESEKIEIGKISDDLFGKAEHVLRVVQALRFMDTTSKIAVIAPISFDLKTEVELMAEFAETQKGMPADIRANAYLNYIEQRFANDTEAKRLAELCLQYSSFILFTIEERTNMVASGELSRENSIKAANVYEVIKNLWLDGKIDIYKQEWPEIKKLIDNEMTLLINALKAQIIADVQNANLDNNTDPTLV